MSEFKTKKIEDLFKLLEEKREAPAGVVLTDEERVRLFKSIISAYSGRYTVEGDTVIHDVELSWNEAWTGTRQVRKFTVNGDELIIETTPRTAGTDTRQFINTLTWERTEAFPGVATPYAPAKAKTNL